MRILQISVICIIISLSCCIEIFAQTSDCIRACNEVFDRDIKSLFTSFSRDELKAQFSEYFSFEEKERRNMQRSSSGSTAFGAVIKGTPIDFSSNKDRSSNFALLKSLFLEYQSTQRINDITLNELLQSSIPDAAFQSYNNCINQCGGLSQNENVQLSVLAKDPDTYIVSIRSKSQVGNQPVTISNVQVAGGFLLGESLIKEGQKIQSSSDVSGLLRRSDENVSLVINFQEAGVNSLRWQGSAPKPPVEDPYFSLVPVGTIIFSVLDYQSFCDANGMPTVFSITNSTWAPCDGRSVSGSKYASRVTNVPDLRGYFVRGVNDMRVPGIGAASVNPENKSAGEIQPDTFQGYDKHTEVMVATNSANHIGGAVGSRTALGGANPRNNPHVKTSGYYDDGHGAPRVSTETRPKNMSVYYYIKIN